jgi:uncharacterized protein (DUF2267 family)
MTRTPNPEPRAPEQPDPAERFFSHIALTGALVRNLTPQAAASAVLCVLSQRVSGGEAVDLRQAMPEPLRDLFKPCPRDRHDQPETFDRHEFLRRVASRLGIADYEAEPVVRAVFHALQEEVPSVRREVDDIESQLPRDLKELWRVGQIR